MKALDKNYYTMSFNLTDEEARVTLYASEEKPTIPNTVNYDTPLDQLNTNWREKDLPEKERTKHVHRLHPYLGKFIPQLVEIFMRKYFKPGQTILDPFCGSGTALVQANELGVNSIGYDISAFNVLLSNVKTKVYNIRLLSREMGDLLGKFRNFTHDTKQPEIWLDKSSGLTLPQNDNEYLHKWFAPKALNELLIFRYLIKEGNYNNTELFKIILSRAARSARLTTHFDLDFPKYPQTEPYWCHKHGRRCSPTEEAAKFIIRYSVDTLRRIQEYSLVRTDAKVEIHHDDSRYAKIPFINGIITSPPYVGLIDYHDQHAYAYHLLGLKDRRDEEIGPAIKGSGLKSKQQYQEDITQVLKNALNSMPSGGLLIVVAHDSSNLYPEIGSRCGIKEISVISRHVNRRTGRRTNEFYESIFIWQKP
jgi:DNA modification methylase